MTDGIFVVDNFIPREDVRAVREEIEKVSLKPTIQAKSIRTDKVSWFSEHFNGPLGQCVKTMKGIGACHLWLPFWFLIADQDPASNLYDCIFGLLAVCKGFQFYRIVVAVWLSPVDKCVLPIIEFCDA